VPDDPLNRIYRYGVEEYGAAAANKFNIYPEAIPLWLMALLRTRYQDLIGAMPMKLSYPALEGNDWALLTGMDLASAGWRLARDDWPEYYDGRTGRLVGRQARLRQTWTLAGYLTALHMQAHPEHIRQLGFGDQATATACTVGTG